MKGKAFNLHLSCYSLDRFTSSQKDNIEHIERSLQKVFFSHYRGKDNLTSNMMGEVMRQVLRPGNRKKAHQSLFPLFWKGWLDDHIFVYFSGFWTGWHSDHSLQFSFIWKISQWILPRTGYKHQKRFWWYHKELLSLSSCVYVCVLMNHCASGWSSTQGSV